MNSPVFPNYFLYSLPTQWRRRCRGDNILVTRSAKENVDELYNNVREVFTSNMRNDLTGVM